MRRIESLLIISLGEKMREYFSFPLLPHVHFNFSFFSSFQVLYFFTPPSLQSFLTEYIVWYMYTKDERDGMIHNRSKNEFAYYKWFSLWTTVNMEWGKVFSSALHTLITVSKRDKSNFCIVFHYIYTYLIFSLGNKGWGEGTVFNACGGCGENCT